MKPVKTYILALFLLMFSAFSLKAQSEVNPKTHGEPGTLLQVSPNPFTDEVILEFNPGNHILKSVKITDIIGKEVVFIDLSHKSGPSAYLLDFSELKTGLYICNVYSDKGIIETRKLYKTR